MRIKWHRSLVVPASDPGLDDASDGGWVGDHADAHEAAEISAEHPVAESSGWSLTHRWDRSPIR